MEKVSRLYIGARERQIMNYLFEAKQDVTVQELASVIDVSARTIHRDLQQVEKTLAAFRIGLTKKAGVGLSIHTTAAKKTSIKQAMNTNTVYEHTPNERQAIILATLFSAKEPIKLFSLAADLHVTAATISHDLDALEEEMKAYHLSFIRKRGFGVQIKGAEEHKRQAISQLVSSFIDPMELVTLYKDKALRHEQTQNKITNRLLDFVQADRLQAIEEAVENVKGDLPYELADDAYIALIIHLALAIERLNNGDEIDFDKDYLEQLTKEEAYQTATLLLKQLETNLNMTIPRAEVGYITMHLLGAKLSVDQHYIIEDTTIDIAYKARELIDYVSEQLQISLDQSPSLLNDLVAHLKPTLYRMKKGMDITNPLLKDIQRDYQDLFDLLTEAVETVFPTITFPADEIGYLVLHFGAVLFDKTFAKPLNVLVVCASGIGTAKILASQLQQQFPEITNIENISMFELSRTTLSDYDIILSTVALANVGVPHTVVSPILTNEDTEEIKKQLQVKQRLANFKETTTPTQSADYVTKLEQLHHYTSVVNQIMESFRVMDWSAFESIENVLHAICQDLEQLHYMTQASAVFQKLVAREALGGMGLPDTTVALYHTRSSSVSQPIFTIYRLKKPLEVQGMQQEALPVDTILMMLAPEKTTDEVLKVLSFISSLLVQQEASATLFAGGSEEEVHQFLAFHLMQFIKRNHILEE